MGVVIVTGGTFGLGQAITLELARRGHRIVACGLKQRQPSSVAEGFEAVQAELDGAGAVADVLEADVSEPAEVQRVVDRALTHFGAIHGLVNNAAIGPLGTVLDTDIELFDRIVAVNLRGTYLMCRAVLPHMIRQGGGRIVAIASDAARVGSTGEAVYSAAKGGVIAFTKTLAREMARHRINVNCVCPGPSDTPLFRTEFIAGRPKLAEAFMKAIPWGRLGRPEDVAGAVVFLASDAAEYITGQTLSVSGGLTMI